MNSKISAAWLIAVGVLFSGSAAQAQQRTQYEALVAAHARANGVPEAPVHRVIVRESKYQPALIGRGGTIGLMQIKLATARGLGYTGTAEGLRDPETNLAYGVKYLAGAYRAANSDHSRAVHYFASGYYYLRSASGWSASGIQNPGSQVHRRMKPGRRRLQIRMKPPNRTHRWKGRSRPRSPGSLRSPPRGSSPTQKRRFRVCRWTSPPVHTPQSRVDTKSHRLTLALFRGELR
jgi:soluble lytic murein transglycosylase-like protein